MFRQNHREEVLDFRTGLGTGGYLGNHKVTGGYLGNLKVTGGYLLGNPKVTF